MQIKFINACVYVYFPPSGKVFGTEANYIVAETEFQEGEGEEEEEEEEKVSRCCLSQQ